MSDLNLEYYEVVTAFRRSLLRCRLVVTTRPTIAKAATTGPTGCSERKKAPLIVLNLANKIGSCCQFECKISVVCITKQRRSNIENKAKSVCKNNHLYWQTLYRNFFLTHFPYANLSLSTSRQAVQQSYWSIDLQSIY